MIVLEQQEEAYKEALNNRKQKLSELNKLEAEITDARQTRAELEDELEINRNLRSRKNLQKQIDALNETIASKEESYKIDEALLQEYAFNIATYEANMALSHQGKYDEMTTVTYNYVKDLETAQGSQKALIEKQIQDETTNLEILKNLKEQHNTDIYNSQIAASENQLSRLQQDLKKYSSTISDGNIDATSAWKIGLAKQLSEITGKNIEFKSSGENHVQLYIDGAKRGFPTANQEMSNLAKSLIKQVNDKQIDAETAGKNLIQGVNNGLTDEQKRKNLSFIGKSLGEQLLSILQNSLQENSPSRATKKMGENLLDGMSSGINNENKRNNIFNSIANFGSRILSKLKASLQENSPSKATEKMGKYLFEGLEIGFDSKESTVLKNVSEFGNKVVGELRNAVPTDFNTDVNMAINQANSSIDAFKKPIKNTSFSDNFKNTIEITNSKISEKLDSIFYLLQDYIPALQKRQLCLDTGALVGELTPLVNTELSRIGASKERGR